MTAPSLSIGLCNYNHAKYVGKALEAILRQSYRPLEVIVIDDGSTDESVAVIERFAKRNPIIRFIRHDRNQGAMYSANEVLQMVSGDYVYYAGADDKVLAGFFEKAMAMAKRYPQAGVIFGKYIAVDSEGNELATVQVSRWADARLVPPGEFLSEYLEVEEPSHSLSAATIYRRDCLEEVDGFRSELGSGADTFAIRAIGLKFGVCYIPEPFVHWRSIRNSFSHLTHANAKSRLNMVARKAYLMRSPEFLGYFPKDHVDNWERNYRVLVIKERMTVFYKNTKEGAQRLQYALSRFGLLGLAIYRPALLAWKGWRWISHQIKYHRLQQYKADLFCYGSE